MRCFCTGGGPLDGKTIETPLTDILRCFDEQGQHWTYHAERWEWNDGRWAIVFAAFPPGVADRATVLAAAERDPTILQPPVDK